MCFRKDPYCVFVRLFSLVVRRRSVQNLNRWLCPLIPRFLPRLHRISSYRKQRSSASSITRFHINSEQSMNTSWTCPDAVPLIFTVLFDFMLFWPVSKENHCRRHADNSGQASRIPSLVRNASRVPGDSERLLVPRALRHKPCKLGTAVRRNGHSKFMV